MLKHAFQSAVPDLGVAGELGPAEWNADHVFDGGSNGAVLVRDSSQTPGANWTSLYSGSLSFGGNPIVSAIWQGTAIATQYGGTGQDFSATPRGSVPYFSATGSLAALAPSTAGYVLTTEGAGADPQWAAPAVGVQSGSSPTWTGQHTWTAAGIGPKIRLSDADSQLFIGTTTDPGWDVSAVQLQHGAFLATSTADMCIALNVYRSGGAYKYIHAGRAVQFQVQDSSVAWILRAAPSGSPDGTITFTDILTAVEGGGLQLGAPTGGDQGAGTLNVATNLFKNGGAYNNPDYVLERAFVGRVDQFAHLDGADRYPGLRSLQEVEAIARRTYQLPLVWEARQAAKARGGDLGLFDGADAVLASLEEAYLHLFDFDRRLSRIEAVVGQ